jgi:hypothetical protein
MPNTSMSQKVVLTLSHNEALVLFDFLARFNEQKQLPVSAQQQILYNLEAILERQLTEVFSPDYNNLVNSAKHLLLKSDDED